MNSLYEEILESKKFNNDQLTEIKKGLEAGLDVSIYANEKYSWPQMREIRLGLEAGLDVSIYAFTNASLEDMMKIRENLEKNKYNELQTMDIKEGYEKGLNVAEYLNSDYNDIYMSEVKRALEEGFESEKIKEVKLALDNGFEHYQLISIKEAIKNDVDILSYVNPTYNPNQILEVSKGLKKGLDVSKYNNPNYLFTQMEQIRLGLEKGLDVSVYLDKEYEAIQMLYIREGLEAGLDVSLYKDEDFRKAKVIKNMLFREYDLSKYDLSKYDYITIHNVKEEIESMLTIDEKFLSAYNNYLYHEFDYKKSLEEFTKEKNELGIAFTEIGYDLTFNIQVTYDYDKELLKTTIYSEDISIMKEENLTKEEMIDNLVYGDFDSFVLIDDIDIEEVEKAVLLAKNNNLNLAKDKLNRLDISYDISYDFSYDLDQRANIQVTELNEVKIEHKTKFEELKAVLNEYISHDYKDYIKAVVSIETGIEEEKVLDEIYNQYIENDNVYLMDNDFTDLAYDVKHSYFNGKGLDIENKIEIEIDDELEI